MKFLKMIQLNLITLIYLMLEHFVKRFEISFSLSVKMLISSFVRDGASSKIGFQIDSQKSIQMMVYEAQSAF